MELNLFRAIQILALADAESPSFDAWYKSIERWYSREFSTSLLEVENLPHEKVLATYFEDHYYEMVSQAAKNEEIAKAYAEFRDRLVYPQDTERVEKDDEEWEKQMLAEIREEEEKLAKAGAKAKKQAEAPVTPKQLEKPKENLNLKDEEPTVMSMPEDFVDSIPEEET